MRGVNKAIIVGTLGDDPTIRATSNGTVTASISVATNESWKDKTTGEQKEATEWHRIVAFGRLAEIMQEYLTKGSQVYIEGKLQTRKWTDKEGAERYTTEINAREMQMLGGKGSRKDENTAPRPKTLATPGPDEDGFDDDIPFN